jgi:hypothetical protein
LEDDLKKAKKKLEEGTLLFEAGAIAKNEYDSYVEEALAGGAIAGYIARTNTW